MIACILHATPARAGGNDEADACAAAAEEAQPKRRAGKLIEARAALLKCSRTACPAFIRSDCTRWLGEVDNALGSVIIRVTDPSGRDLVDVSATMDGAPIKLDGRAISLDPGVHAFRYEAAGHEPASEQIVVRETERNRLVNVVLKPVEVKAARPVPPPPPQSSGGIPPLAFVLGGAGVAAIGVGVAFWVVGSGERGDLRDTCAKTSSCSDDAISAARTKLIVGDVLIGVGAVAAAAGVWVALSSKPSSSAAFRVTPSASGAQLGIGGAF